jgi:hypothetical protein
MQASLEGEIIQERWQRAAVEAGNLSELTLTIGDVTQALAYAEQAVQLADRSGDARERIGRRTNLAEALHLSGHLQEAKSALVEAEKILQETQPGYKYLFAVWGLRYCNLLLDLGAYEEVLNRAKQSFKAAEASGTLLDIALENLSLGRAHLLQSQREPNHPFTESLTYLNRAVDGLRQAGQQIILPIGLLARAEFYRITSALEKGQKDLDEAFAIATRGGMGLHQADCHLEYARFYSAKNDKAKAREHWEVAKKKVEEMGYHRRDQEVEELEKQLK